MAATDPELGDRLRAVRDTYNKDGEPVTGLASLTDYLGALACLAIQKLLGLHNDRWRRERLTQAAGTASPPREGGTNGQLQHYDLVCPSPTNVTPPLTDDNWPSPPESEAFYGLTGEVVRRLDSYTEADTVGVLISTLVMFGNIVGRGPHFVVGATTHFANECALLVGPTARSQRHRRRHRSCGFLARQPDMREHSHCQLLVIWRGRPVGRARSDRGHETDT